MFGESFPAKGTISVKSGGESVLGVLEGQTDTCRAKAAGGTAGMREDGQKRNQEDPITLDSVENGDMVGLFVFSIFRNILLLNNFGFLQKLQ